MTQFSHLKNGVIKLPHRVVLRIKSIKTYEVFRTVSDICKVIHKYRPLLFFFILSLNVKTGHCVPLRKNS